MSFEYFAVYVCVYDL